MQKIAGVLLGLLWIAFLFAACNTELAPPPTPAGAELGLNTFVFFYSDN